MPSITRGQIQNQIALITCPPVHLAMSSSLGAELDDEKVDLSAGIDLPAEEDERPLSFTPPKGLGSMAFTLFLFDGSVAPSRHSFLIMKFALTIFHHQKAPPSPYLCRWLALPRPLPPRLPPFSRPRASRKSTMRPRPCWPRSATIRRQT